MQKALFALVAVLLLGACAVVIGLGDVPPAPDEGGTGDAGDGAISDAPPSDNYVPPFDANGCDACAPPIVPMGWTPAVFSTTTTSCPSGFSNLALVKTAPMAQASACTCSPTNLVQPVCDNGSLSVLDCNVNNPQTVNLNGPGCTAASITAPSSWKASPLAASNGSCTAMATSDTSKLSSTSAAVCYPTGCPDNLCKGMAPAMFSACIETAGDVACPNNDFPNKVAVADAYQLDCSSACSTCTATADCTNAAVYFYTDNTCGSLVSFLTVDGMCHASGVPSAMTSYAKYVAVMQNPKYTTSGSMTGKATPINPKTLCCK